MVDQTRLSRLLALIAQKLITEYSVAEVLHDLCGEVVTLLDADAASVLLFTEDARTLGIAAESGHDAAAVASAQIDAGEGPAVDASASGSTTVLDVSSRERWPRYAASIRRHGVTAQAAFPMSVHGQVIGALEVTRCGARAFDDEHVTGQTIAASATAYVLNARALDEQVTLAEQLQRALESRVVVEQAKGKLSARLDIGVDEAFTLLRGHARRERRKLHQVCEEVVHDRLDLRLVDRPAHRAAGEGLPEDVVAPTPADER